MGLACKPVSALLQIPDTNDGICCRCIRDDSFCNNDLGDRVSAGFQCSASLSCEVFDSCEDGGCSVSSHTTDCPAGEKNCCDKVLEEIYQIFIIWRIF